MRIALVIYGCEPHRGSEFGVGWTWGNALAARGHDVVAYVHAEQRALIEKEGFHPRLSFRFFQPRQWPLEHRNRTVHQVQYTIWQWLVMNEIKKDDATERFDLIHFLTWGGIRMPVFGWRSSIPYVYGPVGGGERAPMRYCASLGLRVFLKEALRNIANFWCRIDPLLRIGYAHAFRNYAKTEQSRALIPGRGRSNCEIVLEIGVPPAILASRNPVPRENKGPFRLVSVSRLLYWKSPLTTVAIFAELMRRGLDCELLLVGSGPDEERVKAALAALPTGSKVTFERSLQQQTLFQRLQEQDLFVFPSLHDSSGNVVLESIASGVPVIALELGGPAEILKGGGGILVSPVARSHSEVVNAFADHIERLIQNRSEYLALRRNALEHSDRFQWDEVIAGLYRPLEAEFGPPTPNHTKHITGQPALLVQDPVLA